MCSRSPEFLVHLDPSSSANQLLAEHPLLKPLMVIVPPTPQTPSNAKSFTTVPTHSTFKNGSAGSRLFAAAHSQAVAQRSPSNALAMNPRPPSPQKELPQLQPSAPLSSISLAPSPFSPSAFTNAETKPSLPPVFKTEQDEEMEFERWYRAGHHVEVIEMDLDDAWGAQKSAEVSYGGGRQW